jgi:hypothetical protein
MRRFTGQRASGQVTSPRICSVSDANLVERAFRQHWGVSAERRRAIIEELQAIVASPKTGRRLKRACEFALIAEAGGPRSLPINSTTSSPKETER